MPRQAHGRPPSTSGNARPQRRKAERSRELEAFAIAQRENAKIRLRPSRLENLEEDRHGKPAPAANENRVDHRQAKRRKTHAHGSSTDEDDAAGDSDGDKWHVGVDGDDEDSDINSENVIDGSDEEKFEGFTFLRSNAQSPRKLPRTHDPGATKNSEVANLEEDSREEASLAYENQSTDEDRLGEGAVDLATALDMNEERENEKEQPSRNISRPELNEFDLPQNTSGGNGWSGSDTSASETERSVLSFSDDEEVVANHARLKSFVQGLEERPSSNAPSIRSQPPMALGEPSDYGLAPSQKLTIADLLGTVTDPRLRDSLKMLHNSELKGSKIPTKGIPGKLDPPLPRRQHDRLDREAAYEKSKETLSRWIDTVKRNRRAEHISFPLLNPDASAAVGTNQLMPISQTEAFTPLESAIQHIMHESGLVSTNNQSAEDKVQAFEELQEKKLPIEEVQVRRAELRRARDLMFREELRARRIKKIKSKAYRRVHRKERDKYAQEERAALMAAGALDSEHERLRHHQRRAEERMGARHKESRWAKGMKITGRAIWDEDARLGVSDLARKDEELRRRIEGKASNRSEESVFDSSDQESSDNTSVDEYDEIERLKLKQKLGEIEMVDQTSPLDSRLSSMPFMQKAESARRAANKAEIDQTRQILAGKEGENEDEEESLVEHGGRRKFGLGQQSQTEHAPRAAEKNDFEEALSEDETERLSLMEGQALEPGLKGLRKKAANRGQSTMRQTHERKEEEHVLRKTNNPWLSGPRRLKSGLTTEEPLISTAAILHDQTASSCNPKSKQLTPKTRVISRSTIEDWTSSSDSDGEVPIGSAVHKEVPQRNEELVRMAFAGDDVFRAFTEEKKATIGEEGDQVVDTTLPGWGSWTGTGISKREKRLANCRKTTKTIKGVEPNKRTDAKLDRVIINQKQLKMVRDYSVVSFVVRADEIQNAKYLAPELPHPFESRQQYERSLRLPLGPEWTTKTTFQDATKPRVLLKQGVIRPIERPIA